MSSIIDAVGNTPLVKLERLPDARGLNVFAKCEFLNPGGSVKDRIAFYMVERAEIDGRLSPGDLIVEATGGNTGIGLALAARLKGYRLLCVMSEKVGQEKVQMMKVLGAETMVVPGGKKITDPDHFINVAKRIASERNAWYVDQFNNPDNAETHYRTTGPEIWKQSEGKVDALVAGIGTGGTLIGAGRYLREQNPNIKLVLADPAGSLLADMKRGVQCLESASYVVEGIGQDFIPGIVDLDEIDEAITVSDEQSIHQTYELLEHEAIFVGGSSGCNVAAAIEFARRPGNEKCNVVVVLPSTGRLYTKTIFDRSWLQTKLPGFGPSVDDSAVSN